MNTFKLEEKVCLITGGLGDIATGVADLVLKRSESLRFEGLKLHLH